MVLSVMVLQVYVWLASRQKSQLKAQKIGLWSPQGGWDAQQPADECSSSLSHILHNELLCLLGGQFVNNYCLLVKLPVSERGFHVEDNNQGLLSRNHGSLKATVDKLYLKSLIANCQISMPPVEPTEGRNTHLFIYLFFVAFCQVSSLFPFV